MMTIVNIVKLQYFSIVFVSMCTDISVYLKAPLCLSIDSKGCMIVDFSYYFYLNVSVALRLNIIHVAS